MSSVLIGIVGAVDIVDAVGHALPAGEEPLVVQCAGHAYVRHGPDLHKVADDGQNLQQVPADEAPVEHEQLRLVAGHETLRLADARERRHLRMVAQKVDRHAVAVLGDDAGDDEQQRPEADEQALQQVQRDELQKEAEAIQKVAETGAGGADRIEQEDDVSRTDDIRHDVQDGVDEPAGGGADLLKILDGVFVFAALDERIVAIQLRVDKVQKQQGKGSVHKGNKDDAGFRAQDELRSLSFQCGSVKIHGALPSAARRIPGRRGGADPGK